VHQQRIVAEVAPWAELAARTKCSWYPATPA